VDGIIGPYTVSVARRRGNDPVPVLVEFAARRAVHYAEGDMADYGLGWMRRLLHVAIEAAG
jgi:hypothetical protein